MRSRLPDRCGPVGARARPTNHRSGSPSAGHYSSQAESPHQPRIALARHQAAGCRGRFIIPAIIPNEANPDSDHSGSNIVALQVTFARPVRARWTRRRGRQIRARAAEAPVRIWGQTESETHPAPYSRSPPSGGWTAMPIIPVRTQTTA